MRQQASISALRWQSGFFAASSLGYFAPVMAHLRTIDGILHVVVGSNDGTAARSDIEALLDIAGPARSNQRIGIASFENAYFHPKTIHFERKDGSAAACVGSANLTASGVSSLHIEAGVLLDTRDGDDPSVLDAIAGAIDWWFHDAREGLYVVSANADLDDLARAGILNVPRPVLVPRSEMKQVRVRSIKARLAPLLDPPPLPRGLEPVAAPTVIAAIPGEAPVLPSRVSAPASPAVAAHWGKALTLSDAQRKRVGNQRGSITLVQAGHPINPQRYFRYEFFGAAEWSAGTTRTGEPLETAVLPFSADFLGTDLGILDLEITYAPNREAAQANYTSLLHLGPLDSYFLRHDVTGRSIELKRRTDGSFALVVS